MFSKKKKNSRPEGGKGKKSDLGNMLGVGLDSEDFSIGMDGMDDDDDEEDDESLEAELAALQGGGQVKRRKKKPMGIDAIEKMAADQLNDDDCDEDVDDEDLENDAELLAELECIAPGEDELVLKDPTPALMPSTVQSSKPEDVGHSSSELGDLLARESMYKTAIENAQQIGDGSKARRFGRGLKKVESMVKQAKAGKPVDLNEMPPPVSVSVTPAAAPGPSETPSADTPLIDLGTRSAEKSKPIEDKPKAVQEVSDEPKHNYQDDEKKKTVEMIKARRDQYKVAALTCKRAGDIPQAKSFLAVSKRIESMIEAAEGGESVDLSQIPEAPSLPKAEPPSVTEPPNQASTVPPEQPKPSADAVPQAGGASSAPKSTEPPPPPRDVLDALTQRLEKYQSAVEQSKQEGNSGKARRMGRIVKQYQDAIKNHKAGKPVDYEELPVPPGFAPIPVPGQAGGDAAQPQLAETQKAAGVQASQTVAATAGVQDSPAPAKLRLQPQSLNKSPSRNTQQLNFLLERQKEFKMAALKAKKQGDIEGAKNYLRMSKGLDPMIEAAQNGIRVDLSTVPDSPGMTASGPAPTAIADSAEIQVEEFRSVPRSPEEVAELFSRLEDALIKQMEMCSRNAKHFQKLGDLQSAKNFEKMAKNMHHDLDSVQSARKHKDLPPKFHYESRSFSIVNSYPELSDSELQIEVVRCLNIPLPSGYQPKDMYTYVTYDFPYPSADEPQSGKTQTVKHSINPEYSEVFKVNIDRKNRSIARIFKRQAMKLEVKYERGFLKGDKTMAQAQIKLAPLDTKCEIHECVDLMDTDRGRRAVGGKIEVKLRLRDPLSEKDVHIDKWKWLVIDLHLSSKKAVPELHEMKASPKTGKSTTGSLEDLVSVEVLKMEKQIIEKQIAAQRTRGQMSSPALMLRSKQCQQKIEEVEKMLSRGEKNVLIKYAREIAAKVPQEQAKAQRAVASGDKAEAQICLARKKLMQNELASLKPKLGLK